VSHSFSSSCPLPAFQRPSMVRKPITRSQPMPRRKAPSRKSPTMIYCESAQEDEALVRFEACPSVNTVHAQAIKVPYTVGTKVRPSTPDFKLGLIDGKTVLVEVKNSHQAKRPDVSEKLSAVASAAAGLGYQYYVVTERWIRFQPVLENLRILARWRSTAKVSANNLVLDDLRDRLPLPFSDVARCVGGRSPAAAYVLANRLHMNLLEEISEASAVLREPHGATAIAIDLPWLTEQGRGIWGGAR